MSGVDVFISYSSEDRTVARRFAEKFAEEGLSVWWDAALHSGETFDEVIENALKAARSVVVLWSRRSVSSRWVRAEATLADRLKKLVPVMIEDCDRPIIFELTHTTDLSHWDGSERDSAWRTVIKDVKRLAARDELRDLERPAPVSRAPASRPTPTPSSGTRFEGRPRAANGGAPVRKLDNMIFDRVDWAGGRGRRNGSRPPASDSEDRTQFYTGTGNYFKDELHCLELTIAGQLEKRYIVQPEGLKIGRAAPADVILADSRVSRSHCMVELLDDDELQVSDLNSTNGTFVDGERVAGSALLPVGSVLKVGNVLFKHEVRTRAEV